MEQNNGFAALAIRTDKNKHFCFIIMAIGIYENNRSMVLQLWPKEYVTKHISFISLAIGITNTPQQHNGMIRFSIDVNQNVLAFIYSSGFAHSAGPG